MAMNADFYLDGNIIDIMLYPGEGRSSIGDDIDVPGYTANGITWWYWDDEKLMRGECDFLGIEVIDIDVTIADTLRWAQRRALELPARTTHARIS